MKTTDKLSASVRRQQDDYFRLGFIEGITAERTRLGLIDRQLDRGAMESALQKTRKLREDT